MTVHHATVKRAANLGFVIADSTENEDAFRLTWDINEVALEGDDAKALVDAIPSIRMLVLEHGCTLTQPETFDVEVSIGDFVLGTYDIASLTEETVTEVAEAIQDARESGELPSEEEADEDEEKGASVVSYAYKRRYAEAGHPAHCGDWLANTLNAECLGENGFNLDVFQSICDANDVDLSPYMRHRTRGWQGRVRMSGRLKLTTAILKAKGVLQLPANGGWDDREVQAPGEWLASKAPKAKGKAAVEA